MFWQPFYTFRKSEDRAPRGLIAAISYINILVSVTYMAINLKLGIEPWANLIQIAGSIATLFMLQLSQSYRPAAHLFLALATVNAVSLISIFNDFPYTILLWIPVFCVIAVYLVGARLGALWGLLATFAASLAILYGNRLGFPKIAIDYADIPAIAILTLFMVSFVAYATSLLFSKSISRLTETLERQNQELKVQNETIAKYAKEKATLVSIVAHDIVSPLTVIAGQAWRGLTDLSLAQDSLEKVQKASQVIEEIIQNVREFEALDSGKKVVCTSKVDLRKVIARAQFMFAERLQEKKQTLEVSIPEGTNTFVLAEEAALSNSVVNNLISNAIKFSRPEQKILLSIEESAEHVILKVRDFGIGIPPHQARNLFQRSKPTTTKGTLGERGSGFGLPITKAYMDRFGGKIDVISHDESQFPHDHGTTFILQLKKALDDE